MMNIHAAAKVRARWNEGALGAALGFTVGAGAAAFLLDAALPLPNPIFSHMKIWGLGLLDFALRTETWRDYTIYMHALADAGHGWAIPGRMAFIGLAGLGLAAWAGWQLGKPRHSMTYLSGPVLLQGRAAKKAAGHGDGLEIAPKVRLSQSKETEHMLIAGGTGSGKSVTGWNILIPAHQRGDRILIVNYKGIIEKMPGSFTGKDRDSIILCPWDSRSPAWAISRDVTTKQHARDLAARIIPASNDPFWSEAARAVFVGCVLSLTNGKGPGNWGFRDLANQIMLPQAEMLELFKEFHPEGIRAVEHPGKTVDSVLMIVSSFCAVIFDLADAWQNRQEFSINGWIRNPNSKIRTVIINISSEFSTLSKAFNQSIINQIVTNVTRLPDVPADQNQMWIYADEFPRLGKIDGWDDFLAVGRSKGMRCVFAVQSASQLINEYNQQIADSWIDSVGIKILGKQDGKGAEWVSNIVGTARYSIPQTTDSNRDGSRSLSYSQPIDIKVFSETDVKTKLGKQKNGMRMLAHGLKEGKELLLDFPFRDLPDLRPATVYATWCDGHTPASEQMGEKIAAALAEPAQPETEFIDSTPASAGTEAEILNMLDSLNSANLAEPEPAKPKTKKRLVRKKPAAENEKEIQQ